jgi:AcrR family transcriptional regulator
MPQERVYYANFTDHWSVRKAKMARIRKEAAVRRTEILDAAQRLIHTKGYEAMTIQDILDELRISKGGFFHHFESKQALLDTLVERMLDQAEQVLRPIVEDPALTAAGKLNRYFATVAEWKTTQKGLLTALRRVWHSDGNAVVRQKHQSIFLERIAPMIAAMIRQGVAEGVFAAAHPEQISEILINLGAGLKDARNKILLADPPIPDALPRLKRLVAAYTEAIERVLGAPAGTLKLVDRKTLRAWAAID